jgi:hypothetical protein
MTTTRILVYGALFLVLVVLAAGYLVNQNRDLILETAARTLAVTARERWGVEIAFGRPRLGVFARTVTFPDVTVAAPGGRFRMTAGRVQFLFSVSRLADGSVKFRRIVLQDPRITLSLAPGEGPGWQLSPAALEAFSEAADGVDIEGGGVRVTTATGEQLFFAESAVARIEGRGEAVSFRIRSRSSGMDLGPYSGRYDDLFLKGRVDPGGVTVTEARLAGTPGEVDGTGSVGPDGRLGFDFRVKADLAEFRRGVRDLVAMTGQVSATGRLEIDRSDWSLSASARVRKLTIGGEPIPDVTTVISLRDGECRFREIIATGRHGGDLRGSCRLHWGGERFGYAFDVRATGVDPVSVEWVTANLPARLVEAVGNLSGSVDFDSGGEEGWTVALDLEADVEPWPVAERVRAKGSVRAAGGGFRLEALRVDGSSLSGVLDLSVDASDSLSGSIEARCTDLAACLERWVGGRVAGEASFRGKFARDATGLLVDGMATSGGLSLNGVAFDSARAAGSWRGGRLEITDGRLDRGGASISLSGSVAAAGDHPEVTASVLWRNLQPVDLVGLALAGGRSLPVTGGTAGELTVGGAWPELRGAGTVRSARMEVFGTVIDEATAGVAIDAGQVRFSRARIRLAGGEVGGDARIGFDGSLEATWSAEIPDLGRVLPGGVDGKARGEGRLTGSLSRPVLGGTVEVEGLAARGVRVGRVRLAASTVDRRLKLAGSIDERFPIEAWAALDGTRDWGGRITFTGLDAGQAGTLLPPSDAPRAWPGGLAFTADGVIDLGGRGGLVTGGVRLSRFDAMVFGESLRLDGEAAADLDGAELRIRRLILTGPRRRVVVEGAIGAREVGLKLSGHAAVVLSPGQVAGLKSVDLAPAFQMNISGPPDAPVIFGSADITGGTIVAEALPEPLLAVAARVEFDGRIVRLPRYSFTYAGRPFAGSALGSLTGKRGEAVLEGALPLSSLRRKLPGVLDYAGEAVVKIKAEIDGGAVTLKAGVAVTGGAFRLEEIATPFKDVQIEASLDGRRLVIDRATARLGGGVLTASGAVDLTPGYGLGQARMQLVADRIYYVREGTFKVMLSGRTVLESVDGGWRISGDVAIERAKYFRDLSPRPTLGTEGFFGSPGRSAGTSVTPAAFPDVALDLRIASQEPLVIDNNVGQFSVSLRGAVTGTLARPLVTGSAEVARGTIFYLGKKFALRESFVRFDDKPAGDPYLSVEAETKVGDTLIRLILDGRLSLLELDLSSEPPYSREDIVSILTFGAPRAFFEGRGRDASAVGALMVMSGPLVGRVESQARDLTGLEVFQIEPTMDGGGGSAKVTVGKNLADRMFVSYSRNIVDGEDEQYSLEYQLTDYLFLIGRQDRKGIYSFSAEFKVRRMGWGE